MIAEVKIERLSRIDELQAKEGGTSITMERVQADEAAQIV